MLTASAVAVLLAATASIPAPADGARPRPDASGAGWRPHVRAAAAYAAHRPGEVSFAIRAASGVRGHRSGRHVAAASLAKTMLLLAYLRRPDVRRRRLRSDERALLGPMIRESDNDAASHIRSIVGLPGLAAVARAARMRDYVPYAAWGSTRTSARDQALLFWRLERLLPRRHRLYGLGLLGRIVSWQRWGIPRAAPRGWRLYFKGGWGTGLGRVDHQAALLRCGRRRRVALAVTIVGSGDHATGAETLRGVAARLLRGIPRCRRWRR